MDTGLNRIDLSRFAALGRPFRGWPERALVSHSMTGYLGAAAVGLLAILTAGAVVTLVKWSPPAGKSDGSAGSDTIRLMTATAPEPARPVIAAVPATTSLPDQALIAPETSPRDVAVTDGLKILSQRWWRGGLGSNALVTFTLRNSHDYAVKDIEISCAFSRLDGSHLTDRTRVIHETVKMKGRRSFAQLHVGFVNVNADRAKCTPVSASRI